MYNVALIYCLSGIMAYNYYTDSHRKRRSATNTTTSDNSTLPAVDIAVATMACMTWDKDKEAWISNACDVSTYTLL